MLARWPDDAGPAMLARAMGPETQHRLQVEQGD